MPIYSYKCDKCNHIFELFFNISSYVEHPRCVKCNATNANREYVLDASTQVSFVKKSDSELKTIGDLAMRNTERMSDDEKSSLYMKHNSYKDEQDLKPLPSGMSRVKKQPKTIWPGTTGKKKRRKTQ